MVHRTCIHEGCSKAPSFGFGGGERLCCSEHKRPGMQYIKHSAADGSTSQEQSHVPRGLDYTPSVTRDPDLNRHNEGATATRKAHCKFSGGCVKAPSFGFPGGERMFCSAHKRPGMEYIAALAEHHRGGAGDALTQAMGHVPRGLDYRPPTTRRSKDTHASHVDHSAGFMSGDGRHCQEEGCTKAPSYGWEAMPGGESSVAIMCAQHKRPAMVYLRHPTHSDDAGTDRYSTGGHSGIAPSKDKNHVPRGLEYIPSVTAESDRIVHSDHPHCLHKDCTKAPSYGFQGQAGVYCFSHKRPGMVFLKRDAVSKATDATKPHSPSGAEAKTVKSHASPAQTDADTSSVISGQTQHESSAGQPSCPPKTSAGIGTHPDVEEESVDADLTEARRCVALAHEHLEDTTVALKYLRNIVKHPEDSKYRTLKTSNRKFYTEVWLNSGMRGLFLALGFRSGQEGTVVLDPLLPKTLECINIIVQEMTDRGKSEGNVGISGRALGGTLPMGHAPVA